MRILSDIVVKSTQQSVKFTLSLLCGAKLKLTLTDCGNITNQFASKREVVHHQKEANVLKKFYSSQLTHHAVTLLENCVWNRSKARRNCLIWSNYHDFHRDRRLVFTVLNNLISQVKTPQSPLSDSQNDQISDSSDRTRRCKQQ